ncbi:phospholipase A-2-activating protein [Halteromyces radiatus]|uniref:phospholipase A-2-activating protein n=1 Tax=Halteromyces radiatus TaxID=101107 RepID=UPI00221F78D6|nr:phospholipase A-2-activating protein [Halteromyces radiatus]KAI8099820.1 phospholipase A-2-activating protein [Halteromyces radiatus]
MSNFYKLETSLHSHEQDVKAVACLSNDFIISGSRDKSVRSWTRTTLNSFSPHNTYLAHDHYVNALVALPPTENYPEGGLFASSGSDKLIHVYESFSPSSPLYTLVGHSENVCALSVTPNGDIISGSWDQTAIVWKNFQKAYTLEGHTAAVLGVLGFENDTFLTASADKTIRLWQNGKHTKTFNGHQDVVRGLTLVPGVGFASCSNDGTIRIWSLNGECLQELYGHTSFVYSLATLTTGELVSSGEDRTVRIWKDGDCIQTIQQPCISVWCVATLPNNDIVVGGSDAVVRLYTRSNERAASAEDIKELEDLLANQAIPSNQIGDVNKNDLPGPEALLQPGKKEGQVLMVNVNGSVEAHQWDSTSKSWQKIGEVVGGVGSGQKQFYNGKEYDFVFDIDIGAGPNSMLKLPYNLNQNPYDAAQKFLLDNELSPMYVDQIVDFISKNTQGVSIGQSTTEYQDPFTGGSRYTPGQSGTTTPSVGSFIDPFTGASGYHGSNTPTPTTTPARSQVPRKSILPVQTYLSLKQANVDAVVNKLRSLNNEIAQDKLDESELASLERLVQYLKNPNSTSSVGEDGLFTIVKICQHWPIKDRFPALDILRLLALYAPEDLISAVPNGNAVAFFSMTSRILEAASSSNTLDKVAETNAMLGYRGLANLFNHQVGRKAILDELQTLISTVQNDIVLKYKAKSTRLAISTLSLNFAVFLTNEARDEDTEISLTGSLVELIKQEQDEENLYRLLMALGTLFIHSPPCLEMANILDIKVELRRLKQAMSGRDRMQHVLDELVALSK